MVSLSVVQFILIVCLVGLLAYILGIKHGEVSGIESLCAVLSIYDPELSDKLDEVMLKIANLSEEDKNNFFSNK